MRSIQQSIKVMVRIRPPSNCIIYRGQTNSNILHCGQKEHYLDHVFVAEDTNDDILQKVGYELVSNTLQGYNSTLFVYGHTGSGKTYTMNGCNQQEGIIYKTFKLLLKMLQNQAKFQYFSLKISYFEIYNQQVKDLLGINKINVRLKIDKGFYLQGLQECQLSSNEQFLKIFRKGMHNRKTDTTKMNSDSSRSHAILTFIVETKQKLNQSVVCKTSKLNFVDLAGAERLKQTEAIGQRKSQAVKINTSLSVLKRVINMLSANKNKLTNVIPYRQSVLTMILKDSLGGNSHTIIIGTIHNNIKNPSNTNDMLATLQFLQRAKKVKNQKKINEKLQGNEERMKQKVSQYELQMTSLKEETQSLKCQLQEAKQTIQAYSQEIKELKQSILQMQTPAFQFVEEKEEFFSKAPFQNAKSYKDELQVIFQENNSFKSVNDTNQYKSCEENKQSKSLSLPSLRQNLDRKSGIIIRRSEKTHNQQQLNLEVNYLQEKLQNLQQYQSEQQQILSILRINIENLRFDDAQLNVLQAQHKRINSLEKQLKRSEIYSKMLLTEFENEKNNLKKKYEGLENISDRSSIILAQKKLNSNISQLQLKIEKLEHQKNDVLQESKAQILKLEEQINELAIQNQKLQKTCQSLQINYNKLQVCFQQSQKQQKQMDKLIQQHRVTMMQDNEFIDIVKQLNFTNQEQENSLIKELNALTQNLAQINQEKIQLQLQLQHLKRHFEQQNQYIQQLREQVQSSQKKLQNFEQQYVRVEEFSQMKSHYLQTQQSLKITKEIIQNFKDCLKVSVENNQITINEVLSQYHTLKKRVQQLQQINGNQLVKYVELQANLQMQRCRLSVFNNVYKQNVQQQGKILTQKDEQIQLLNQKLEKLCAQIQSKQHEVKQFSEMFQSKASKSKVHQQQIQKLCDKLINLQGQNYRLKDTNKSMAIKLQTSEKLLYQRQLVSSETQRVLREKNGSLISEYEKIKKKNTDLKTQTIKYSEWMMKQLEQYNNSGIAKNCQIKNLKKENQILQNQIKRLKEQLEKQGKEDELKKANQLLNTKQNQINNLYNIIEKKGIQKTYNNQLINQYNRKIKQLNEELIKNRYQQEQQRRQHLLELNSLRSHNFNTMLIKQKNRLFSKQVRKNTSKN